MSHTSDELQYTKTITNLPIASTYSMVDVYVEQSGIYELTFSANNPIDVVIYDEQMRRVLTYVKGGEEENEYKYFLTASAGRYYIRAEFSEDVFLWSSITTKMEYHATHNFDRWIYYSSTQHIECCECLSRGTALGVHVVKLSETIIENKRPCLKCGAIISDTGPGFGQIIMNVQKVTVNGSYILPNGIIVLVDEDVDAYFAGTLVFYDKDELPKTE